VWSLEQPGGALDGLGLVDALLSSAESAHEQDSAALRTRAGSQAVALEDAAPKFCGLEERPCLAEVRVQRIQLLRALGRDASDVVAAFDALLGAEGSAEYADVSVAYLNKVRASAQVSPPSHTRKHSPRTNSPSTSLRSCASLSAHCSPRVGEPKL
jgi:hypothetical protein